MSAIILKLPAKTLEPSFNFEINWFQSENIAKWTFIPSINGAGFGFLDSVYWLRINAVISLVIHFLSNRVSLQYQINTALPLLWNWSQL